MLQLRVPRAGKTELKTLDLCRMIPYSGGQLPKKSFSQHAQLFKRDGPVVLTMERRSGESMADFSHRRKGHHRLHACRFPGNVQVHRHRGGAADCQNILPSSKGMQTLRLEDSFLAASWQLPGSFAAASCRSFGLPLRRRVAGSPLRFRPRAHPSVDISCLPLPHLG